MSSSLGREHKLITISMPIVFNHSHAKVVSASTVTIYCEIETRSYCVYLLCICIVILALLDNDHCSAIFLWWRFWNILHFLLSTSLLVLCMYWFYCIPKGSSVKYLLSKVQANSQNNFVLFAFIMWPVLNRLFKEFRSCIQSSFREERKPKE